MPKTLNWLHVSDLHICDPLTGWDAHRVLRTLVEDLAHMRDEFQLHPDFIFFTGDAVFGHLGDVAGKRITDQFEAAANFFEDVRRIFDPDISKENFFLVPGNHDVNRSLVLANDTQWLDEQEDEYPITKTLLNEDERCQSFLKRLGDYRAFLTARGYSHLVNSTGHFHFATIRDVRGLKVGIAGLNSAWACCRDKEKGKLWIGGKWQIEIVCRALAESDLRIALIHHPPGWFVPQEDNQIAKQIKLDFDFHLHGHEHESWVDPSANGHTRIAAGAGYDSSNLENGYNFVQLDLGAGTGKVWLRKYEKKGRAWVPEIIGGGLTDENGCWRLPRISRKNLLSPKTGQTSEAETLARQKVPQWAKRIFQMQDPRTKGIRGSPVEPESSTQVWSTSQCMVAVLRSPEANKYSQQISDALNYIETNRQSREGGWSIFGGQDATVTEIGCWAVLAMIESLRAQLTWPRKETEKKVARQITRTLDYLVTRQFEDGGCCPTGEVQAKNTRTYSTAMVLWALARATGTNVLALKNRYDAPIANAVRWLFNYYLENRGWVPNPNRKGQTQHYFGLHAQVLFILLEAEPHCDFLSNDRLFQQIKEEFLALDDFRTRGYDENSSLSGADQKLYGTEYRLEGSLYLWCPWALAALNLLARNASVSAEDRERSARLKRQVFAKLVPMIDDREELWEFSECLLGAACCLSSASPNADEQPRTVCWTKTELVEIYNKHPLREKTILERLRRQGKDLDALSEADLALDDKTELTDQNHIGGLRFTEELAQAARITSASRVLDIGSGLGGSARVIANLCQCSIQGIELTRSRHNDAVALTQRLGMAGQIQFTCGDFLTEDLPNGSYDVVLAQATLAHFPDKKEMLARCASLLKSEGRLAVEEAYLTENGWNDQARERLQVLESCWKSYLMPLTEWLAQSATASLSVIVNQDLTPAFVEYYSGLLSKTTRAPQGTVTELEIQGWKNGLALAEAGLLVYVRTVAKKI